MTSSSYATSLPRLHRLLLNFSFSGGVAVLRLVYQLPANLEQSQRHPQARLCPKSQVPAPPLRDVPWVAGQGDCPSSSSSAANPKRVPGDLRFPPCHGFPRASLSHPMLVTEQTPCLAQEEIKQSPLMTGGHMQPPPFGTAFGVGGGAYPCHAPKTAAAIWFFWGLV